MRIVLVYFCCFCYSGFYAQQIQFLELPSFFEREYEISGLTGNQDYLFLAAERCEKIFVIQKNDLSHVKTIQLNIDSVTDGIEIEGLSIYKNYILMTDEKNGKLFSFNLATNTLQEIIPKGKDLSSFRGNFGIEGVAVDETSHRVYILREKNENHQSEVHCFSLTEEKGSLLLTYRNQTNIQHPNANWRYTGLSIDSKNKRLLCLKSYYIKEDPKSCRREIEFIPVSLLSSPISDPVELLSLSDEIYMNREYFATNVEGIYADKHSIFVTSDNGSGNKDCAEISSKTVMIRTFLPK